MTATGEDVRPGRATRSRQLTHLRRAWPTAAAAVSGVVFLFVDPPVGDLWAARARESAAAHGVGLGYWYGGTVPGHYSVLEPYVAVVTGSALLGAICSVLVVGLTQRLVRGGAGTQQAAACAVVAAVCRLWSGRVPFLLGATVAL